MNDGWPERFNPLWDLTGNTKVVGRWYLTFRRGKGAGWPIQRTWLNEVEDPWRYGWGFGVRLPRRIVSIGRWSKTTQPEYAAQPHECRGKRPEEMKVLSTQTGGGAWDVLVDT